MVSNKTHQATLTALSVAESTRFGLERHIATQDVMIKFICTRVNQLEVERAILLRKITNVDFPVPQVVPAAPSESRTAPITSAADMLASLGAAAFEDMGDDEAKRQGVRWGSDGRVEYRDPNPDAESAPA